ncbi:hypothetical protein [Candidatus Pantoea multigeneris]|uniref:DUF1453 domain-containing protein n=1 Tax=Candidatus Pantoea multigeneris TaxID=2608357 RepID=A0ABX0R8F1_9GAMM|nr:hypothetical protein [Pantoea multigeneris]NIF21650.1 hypothetical protein [Pantoea multigeneris]
MLGIVSGTPIWVFILLAVVAAYCITFCFEKVVNIKFLLLIPVCFMIFSFINLLQQDDVFVAILTWVLGCVIGGSLAKKIFGPKTYRLGQKEGTVTVSGTYSVIIIFLIYFPLRYYIGYSQATAENHHLSHALIILLAVSSGCVVGFFTLRSYIIYQRYKALSGASSAQ